MTAERPTRRSTGTDRGRFPPSRVGWDDIEVSILRRPRVLRANPLRTEIGFCPQKTPMAAEQPTRRSTGTDRGRFPPSQMGWDDIEVSILRRPRVLRANPLRTEIGFCPQKTPMAAEQPTRRRIGTIAVDSRRPKWAGMTSRSPFCVVRVFCGQLPFGLRSDSARRKRRWPQNSRHEGAQEPIAVDSRRPKWAGMTSRSPFGAVRVFGGQIPFPTPFPFCPQMAQRTAEHRSGLRRPRLLRATPLPHSLPILPADGAEDRRTSLRSASSACSAGNSPSPLPSHFARRWRRGPQNIAPLCVVCVFCGQLPFPTPFPFCPQMAQTAAEDRTRGK
jgi:hypothetical protein